MNRHTGSFWLSLATYWIKAVTVIATLATAFPGLRRIDSVMISGSEEWSTHGPVLIEGVAYLAGAVIVLAAGLAIGDLLHLALRWEAQLRQREESPAPARPQPALAPLPTSRALLESLGIASAQPARVPVARVLQRNQ